MAHSGALARTESVEKEMHKSQDHSKTFVFTKKRGYDVTRNPHLNKLASFPLQLSDSWGTYWPHEKPASGGSTFEELLPVPYLRPLCPP
uniref:Uncharacterized protein n=1 Tax=Knipowitschia caucasica TaxID=637954 RepID=A0AAV2MB78_KNICA